MPSRYRKVLNPITGKYVKKSSYTGLAILRFKARRKRSPRRRSKSPHRSPNRMSSRRKNQLLYGDRPSPSASATLFSTGSVREGNDNHLWTIKKTSSGVKRWVRV